MRSEVLETLISQGSLVGVVTSKPCDVERTLGSFARSLCGGAPFLFSEFSRNRSSATDFLQERKERLGAGVRYIFVVFPGELDKDSASVLASMRMALVLSENGQPIEDELLSELESLAPFKPGFFWWLAPKPDKKRFPKLSKSIGSNCLPGWTSAKMLSLESENAAQIFLELLRSKILRENALVGWPRFFRKFFIPLGVLVAALPFFVPSNVDSGPSLSRNLKSEMAFYSEAPYFDYTFDGTEPVERIARYAVGRFAALVTTERTLGNYVGETLEKNGFPENSWQKGSRHVPPQGTTLRFSIPETLKNPAYDSIAPVWKFFTRIIGDSVAYVTELYSERPTAQNRKHPAWDVASRSGARILSPFSGKAWTFRDDRGGTIIGIVGEKRVILFMHCDQLLYLDGQNVMQGDPVATVGTTGHTTGPHVHIVTGLIDRNGSKRLGNVRYRIVSPVTWYYFSK